MDHFIKKHEKNIIGTLTGFDRLVIRGTMPMLCIANGLAQFLRTIGILLKDFGEYAEKQTRLLKEASLKEAQESQRPIIYLQSPKEKKEPKAREIAKKDKITSGLICIFTCVEPCNSFEIFRNKETKRLDVKPRHRQCLHIYKYWIDPELGFISARIQTWFPFSIQICLNGREYLATQMNKENIFNVKEDNCFTYIDDFQRAQELMDSLLEICWPKYLNEIAARLNPEHEGIFEKFPHSYYWTVHQSEMATDIVFNSARDLDRIYPTLIRGALTSFSCSNVMQFFGKTLSGAFKGQLNTDMKEFYQGTRIKHWVGCNSIKFYNKMAIILRIETTINNPRDFKVYRPKQSQPEQLEWQKMRKGVADIHRRAEVSTACNNRYLNSLATFETNEKLPEIVKPVCQRTKWKKRSIRGLRPYNNDDLKLLEIINYGEFAINGFTNKDILSHFFSKKFSKKEKIRASAKVTRMIRMLRAHGIVKKISRGYRYHLTTKGRKVVNAILLSQDVTIQQLNSLAA